jgi:immunoglobulin-binding protein 1
MVEVEEVGNRMHSQMRLDAAAGVEDADADLPLPALFDRASRLHGLASSSALDQVPPSSGSLRRPCHKRQEIGLSGASGAYYVLWFCAGQEGIRKGVELLRRCDEMVSKLGLFSTNETKEDVSTANLKYLLVRTPSLPLLC